MKRRDLLQLPTALGLASVLPAVLPRAAAARSESEAGGAVVSGQAITDPLTPPRDGLIPVAFLLSEGAVVIDFAGPWEVFSNVRVPGPKPHPFELYTVAETTAAIHTSGGMTIVPNYSIATAPAPRIIVIPAQSEPSKAVITWLRNSTRSTDVTMSVCTGAFVLAKAGLLSGKTATTHHSAYAELAMAFPDVTVKRGARFVDAGNIASSGGLSSGIDLALHVVERYFGRAVAQSTVDNLEYQGLGWMNPDSNSAYAQKRVSTDEHPLCPVCEMDVDPTTAPRSTYRGHTYYFCMNAHKSLFDTSPERFVAG